MTIEVEYVNEDTRYDCKYHAARYIAENEASDILVLLQVLRKAAQRLKE